MFQSIEDPERSLDAQVTNTLRDLRHTTEKFSPPKKLSALGLSIEVSDASKYKDDVSDLSSVLPQNLK